MVAARRYVLPPPPYCMAMTLSTVAAYLFEVVAHASRYTRGASRHHRAKIVLQPSVTIVGPIFGPFWVPAL